jgi:hypothetical protein
MERKTPRKRKDAPAPRRQPERQELPEPEDAPARYEDPVDEASAESMDASDPPARGTARIGPAKRGARRR